MNFLNNLFTIFYNFLLMMFTFDSSNPFVYITGLIIVSIITIGFFKTIFKHI